MHRLTQASRGIVSSSSAIVSTIGIAQNIERIDILVPRSILELKNCILEQQIDALTQELRVTADLSKCNELMQQLAEKIKIKKSFDKELGERVIIPGRR